MGQSGSLAKFKRNKKKKSSIEDSSKNLENKPQSEIPLDMATSVETPQRVFNRLFPIYFVLILLCNTILDGGGWGPQR